MKKNTLYLLLAALGLYFFTKNRTAQLNAVSAQDPLTLSNNQDSINV